MMYPVCGLLTGVAYALKRIYTGRSRKQSLKRVSFNTVLHELVQFNTALFSLVGFNLIRSCLISSEGTIAP